MAKRKTQLTEREKRAAEVFAKTGSRKAAQEAGGYSASAGFHLALQRPRVQAEIQRIANETLTQDILPLALATHRWLLQDPTVPAGAKVQAVKLAYDRALGVSDGTGKAPEAMTPDELADAIEKLRARLADKAKVIDAEVVDPAPPGDVFG